jgi:hypothetical protein
MSVVGVERWEAPPHALSFGRVEASSREIAVGNALNSSFSSLKQ